MTPPFGLISETPYPAQGPLLADRFRCDTSFRNWRPRGTPDWLLILTVKGSGNVGTKTPVFSTSPGELILFEPHTPQTYATNPSIGKWELLWTHFYPRPHWKAWLRWPPREKGLLVVPLNDPGIRRHVLAALQDCVRWHRQCLINSSDLAFNALERALVWAHAGVQSRPLDERIRRAADLLAEEVHRPLVLSALARRCGLSLSRFAHLFRQEMGSAPQQYLERLRMERAARMLRSTARSVSEIASESGYANALYFSNRFRKAFRRSPSAYRAEGS